MGDFRYFDRGNALIGGAPSSELSEGGIDLDSGWQDTIGMGGHLGGSKGPVMATVHVTRSKPRAGLPPAQRVTTAVIKQTPITVVVVCGGDQFTVTGVPRGLSNKFGATSTANESFNVTGRVEHEYL